MMSSEDGHDTRTPAPVVGASALARVEGERTAAYRARDAAEDARDRAEVARDAAEDAGAVAGAEVTELREAIAFCEEQARSTRELADHLDGGELAELRADRAALLEELTVYEAELQHRARVDEARGAM